MKIPNLEQYVTIFPVGYRTCSQKGQKNPWPQAGTDNPLGTKFWWQQKGLIILPICCMLQNDLFEIWFYTHLNDFIHVYSPGARAENHLGTNFWCQQKALISSTICCKFQTNLFEFWFYTRFNVFPHEYSPGAGADTFCGQNPDVNRKALSRCPLVASFKKISLKSDFIHNFSCFYTCI